MHRLRCLTLAWLGMAVVTPALAQPKPESVIGFAPCSDCKLATYEAIAD